MYFLLFFKKWIETELPKFSNQFRASENKISLKNMVEETENLGFIFDSYEINQEFSCNGIDFSDKMNKLYTYLRINP